VPLVKLGERGMLVILVSSLLEGTSGIVHVTLPHVIFQYFNFNYH